MCLGRSMALADIRISLVKRISKKFFYGWVMLGIGALGMFASGPGQSHTFSVFVGPIGKELGFRNRFRYLIKFQFTIEVAFRKPGVCD